MANWKKIGIVAGIGAGVAGAAGLIKYFTGLKRTSDELESVSSLKIHSLKVDGLTLRIDVQLKNPTNSSLKIKFPFVKVLYKEKTIGTSKVIDKDIELPAYGEANISEIMIKIPMMGLLSAGAGLYKMLVNNEPAPFFVKTITTIDLGWKKIPYSKTDDNTLNPKA